MAIKNALRERAKKLFATAGLQTLYSERVEYDKIHRIEQVAWEIDLTTKQGKDRVRLYIAGHGYKHDLEEQGSPTATRLYTYNEPFSLIPGERLAIEIDQGQEDTTAQMEMLGYWTEQKEGIVT
ncbi:hypothetical protein ES703_89756 [subsurface metagenome]